MRIVIAILSFFVLVAPNSAIAHQRVILEGRFMQGGLVLGHAAPGAKIELDSKAIRVDGIGRFLIGFGRDHPPSVQLKVTYPNGSQELRELTIRGRDYAIQRVDGVPQSRVTPPPEVLSRIKSEGQKKRAARQLDAHSDADGNADSKGYDSAFVWPALGPITGVYGSQRVYNGTPKNPHFGVDVGGPVGAPVVAPAPGVVTLAEDDMYYEGGLIFVDHGLGLISVFMHLSSVDVSVGEIVAQGTPIGKIGATGRVTGPHLDWRMYWQDQRVDPALLVEPMGDAIAKTSSDEERD